MVVAVRDFVAVRNLLIVPRVVTPRVVVAPRSGACRSLLAARCLLFHERFLSLLAGWHNRSRIRALQAESIHEMEGI